MSRGEREQSSFADRAVGAVVGGAAGAVAYFSWAFFSTSVRYSPDAWSFSGPVKWFVLVGVFLGAAGGRSLAQALWSKAVGDVEWESASTARYALFVLALLALVAQALKLRAA